MSAFLTIECDAVRQTFREWHAEHEQLDAQLSESLSALAAYQSHLDKWQEQLSREREELRTLREQLEAERVAVQSALDGESQPSAELASELAAARDKNASLSASLVTRTEELRALDQQRIELTSELERARAREKELQTTFEGQKRELETEREKLAEEIRRLQVALKQQGDAAPSPTKPNAAPHSAHHEEPAERKRASLHENPVLGSIVEQFGKLRQQRAIDRQAAKKSR